MAPFSESGARAEPDAQRENPVKCCKGLDWRVISQAILSNSNAEENASFDAKDVLAYFAVLIQKQKPRDVNAHDYQTE